MGMYTTLILENEAIGGDIPPQALSNASVSTGWADASLFNRMEFTFQRGSGVGSIVGAIYQSQFANGASPTLIVGPNQNATSVANVTGNTWGTVECRSDQMTSGANPPYRYVSGKITEGNVASTVVSGTLMLCEPRYGPQAGDDANGSGRVYVN